MYGRIDKAVECQAAAIYTPNLHWTLAPVSSSSSDLICDHQPAHNSPRKRLMWWQGSCLVCGPPMSYVIRPRPSDRPACSTLKRARSGFHGANVGATFTLSTKGLRRLVECGAGDKFLRSCWGFVLASRLCKSTVSKYKARESMEQLVIICLIARPQ